jgi:flagellar biosynthetic protein FlhB
MAETPDGMEKSEQPTGKKLGDARDRGLVAKSVDLTSAAVLLFGGLIVFGFGNTLSAQLMAFMKQLIINAPRVVLNEENIPHYYGQLAGLLGILLLPILFLIAAYCTYSGSPASRFSFCFQKIYRRFKYCTNV